MRVIQIVPSLLYGDAVGNDVLAFFDVLKKAGYETSVYSYSIDKRLAGEGIFPMEEIPSINDDDVVIYHMACGSELSFFFKDLTCKKMLIYHNITPPHFFELYDKHSERICGDGYKELELLANYTDYALADSEYNRLDLVNIGFKCPTYVLPIVMPFSDYDIKPAENIIKDYGEDDYVNILFVGRVVPNKRQEDVIAAFNMYQRLYNKKCRLILVGSSNVSDRYRERLTSYIDFLSVENVIFPGHIRFDEIIGFYKTADVFLCQSDHEGFCVPLIEAMYLKTPIIAYDSTAVGYTLGDAGIQTDTKDPVITAGIIDRLVKDEALKKEVLKTQEERLKDFSHEKITKEFLEHLEKFIKG